MWALPLKRIQSGTGRILNADPCEARKIRNAVAQQIELWLANQKVAGSIPSQGTCLDCGWVPAGDV